MKPKARDSRMRALDMRIDGANYALIAKACGYEDAIDAMVDVKAFRREMAKESREARQGLVERELEALIERHRAASAGGTVSDSEFIRKCLADYRKLFGLDVPARVEFSGPGGGAIEVDLSKLSDSDLDKLRTSGQRGD